MKISSVLDCFRLPASLRTPGSSYVPQGPCESRRFRLRFRFRRQCRHGVNDDNVYCARRARASQISSACSPVSGWEHTGCRYRRPVYVRRLGPARVQIDKRTGFTFTLRCGDHLQRHVVLPEDSGP